MAANLRPKEKWPAYRNPKGQNRAAKKKRRPRLFYCQEPCCIVDLTVAQVECDCGHSPERPKLQYCLDKCCDWSDEWSSEDDSTDGGAVTKFMKRFELETDPKEEEDTENKRVDEELKPAMENLNIDDKTFSDIHVICETCSCMDAED